MNEYKESLNRIDANKRKRVFDCLRNYHTSEKFSYKDLIENVSTIVLPNEPLIVVGMSLYAKNDDKEKILEECVKKEILEK
uniref:DNA alkylation repair protein n=1 Tax=Parastrongyloides trichosuri TaxID=131310 RepID=A0A0N4ZRU8_PARTI